MMTRILTSEPGTCHFCGCTSGHGCDLGGGRECDWVYHTDRRVCDAPSCVARFHRTMVLQSIIDAGDDPATIKSDSFATGACPAGIVFRAFGTPMPAGSKTIVPIIAKGGRRVGSRIIDDASKGKSGKIWEAWRQSVAVAARQVYAGVPLDVPIVAHAWVFEARTANHYGTGKNAATLKAGAPDFPVSMNMHDATKLWRNIEDVLKGIVFRDDKLVVDEHIYKRWALHESEAGAAVIIQVKGKNDGSETLFKSSGDEPGPVCAGGNVQ